MHRCIGLINFAKNENMINLKHFIIMVFITGCTGNYLTAQKRIVMVLSAADTISLNQGEKQRQTGVFLNEFYLAYHSIKQAGYQVNFATAAAKTPSIDKESTDDKYWKDKLELKKQAIAFVERDSAFLHPKSLEYVLDHHDQYIGLVIPGGQGLMVDLAQDKHIPRLLQQFAIEQKPTGLICHAPSLLLSMAKQENPYIGYKVSAVSPMEEFVIERFIMNGKPASRKIGKRLRKYGFKYRSGLPKANFAIKDQNLVTSQNPFSSAAFSELYLEALSEYQAKN